MIKHMKRCIFTKVKFMALFLLSGADGRLYGGCV